MITVVIIIAAFVFGICLGNAIHSDEEEEKRKKEESDRLSDCYS